MHDRPEAMRLRVKRYKKRRPALKRRENLRCFRQFQKIDRLKSFLHDGVLRNSDPIFKEPVIQEIRPPFSIGSLFFHGSRQFRYHKNLSIDRYKSEC